VTTRRELVLAVLLGAAGGGLVAGFAGRPWAVVTERTTGLEPFTQQLTGRSLSGAAAALGWAGLAGIAALLATRGWARVVIGALLAVFGAGIAALAPAAVSRAHVLSVAGERTNLARLSGDVGVHVGAWWVVSLAGGVLLAAAGLLTVLRGRRWPGMSSRYEHPGAAASPRRNDPSSLWKALDRGDDPTTGDLKEL
jgi:uncharacterized membrane protein (TIGR02234 family)